MFFIQTRSILRAMCALLPLGYLCCNDGPQLEEENYYRHEWHTFIGCAEGKTQGFSVANVKSGGVVIAGPANCEFASKEGMQPINGHSGEQDIFVLKLSEDGEEEWYTYFRTGSYEMPGQYNWFERGPAISAFDTGEIVVTGSVSEDVRGPNGESPLNEYSGSWEEILVLKLGSDGTYLWHTIYGNGCWNHHGRALAQGTDGSIYVSGGSDSCEEEEYYNWLGPDGQNPLKDHNGGENIYVMKLDSSGEYLWHTFYGGEWDAGFAMESANGDGLVITGKSHNAWHGPDGQLPNHEYNDDGTASSDAFVLKLNGSGEYGWHTFYGAKGYEFANDLAITDAGDVYIVGGSEEWTGPEGQQALTQHGGDFDAFILKLNKEGDYLWHTFCGGDSREMGLSIAIDEKEYLYVVGQTAGFEGPAGQSPVQGEDIGSGNYLVKIDRDGGYKWHGMWGRAEGYGSDECNEITLDEEEVYITGSSLESWRGPRGQKPLRSHSGAESDAFAIKMELVSVDEGVD